MVLHIAVGYVAAFLWQLKVAPRQAKVSLFFFLDPHLNLGSRASSSSRNME
jgi:hypothetical protein